MSEANEIAKLPDETEVARPLRLLIPLIQEDLEHARDAADRAGMPYYRAAGEKLLEAKAQMEHGAFQPWVTRHFKIRHAQARVYMALAKENAAAAAFSSLSDFQRQKGHRSADYHKSPEWHAPVKQIVGRVDTDKLNLKREELKRADEREAQRTLGRQLIDIGYKVLARKLHPDRGGSREAMARLNAVRDRLKLHA